MTDQNASVTRCSDADFDKMSWHDCWIHCVALDQDGEYQSDLVLDLGYIVEWIETSDGSFLFRVAPALLRFQNVGKLHIHTRLEFKQPLEIYSIDRVRNERTSFRNCHWTIAIQSYSEEGDNRIEFDATGFVQELTASPVEIAAHSLTRREREEMKNRNGEQRSALDS